MPGIGGDFVAAGWAARALVVLLSPDVGGIGACELARIPVEGKSKTVPVPGTRCGSDAGARHSGRARAFVPALAVDPVGDAAFIAPGGSSVFEVDLRTMAAGRHELGRSSRTFASVLGWTAPTAQAKSVPQGPVRHALVTAGSDGLAVYGPDGSLRYRLFAGRAVYAEVGFGHAIVSTAEHPATRSSLVVLSTGKIVGRGPTASMPGLLDADVTP